MFVKQEPELYIFPSSWASDGLQGPGVAGCRDKVCLPKMRRWVGFWNSRKFLPDYDPLSALPTECHNTAHYVIKWREQGMAAGVRPDELTQTVTVAPSSAHFVPQHLSRCITTTGTA